MNKNKERKVWDARKTELPERCVVIDGVIAVILPTSPLSSQSCMIEMIVLGTTYSLREMKRMHDSYKLYMHTSCAFNCT